MFVSLTIQLLVYCAPCPKNPPSTFTPTLRENTDPENTTVIITEGLLHPRALEHGERVTDFESGLERHQWALKGAQKFPALEKRGDFPLRFPLWVTAQNPSSGSVLPQSPDQSKVTLSLWNSTVLALWCAQFGTQDKCHLISTPLLAPFLSLTTEISKVT